jgi:hypothetical protein
MRLTLRTMLAYMDSVLEPNESEELGRKIRESKFASDLVDQIRAVTNKVRMDAPKLEGKGMGNDANTVAEYLDSALPQDRVGDFERVCLESNKHLAEVAGCHQILALVLGKPADVPVALRDRVYGLGHAAVNDEPKPAVAAKAKVTPVAAAGSNGHAASAALAPAEIPDYLRAGRSASIWQFLGAVAVVFLLAALALRLMGPFNSEHPVLRLVRGGPVLADANTSAATGQSPQVPIADKNSAKEPAASPTPSPATTGDSETPKATSAAPTPAESTSSAADAKEPMSKAAIPAVPDTAAAETPEPMPKPLPAAPEAPKQPEPTPPPPAMEVGRFISDEQVLAHQPKGDGIWLRMPPRAVLSAGERLVALPAFRSQIALASGVQVTFAGESSVRLGEPNSQGASRMTVDDGRLLMVTVGAPGAQVELDLGGVRGVVTLVDADSAVAIAVKRFLPPGTDPESMPPFAVVEIFNTFGRMTWTEVDQPRVEIPTNQVRIYAGGEPPDNYGPFALPEWIDAKSIAPIDRESQAVLERLLAGDKALNLTLAETLEHRQVNVRALAARCLAVLDEFEPILKELNDPRQQAFWSGEFATLRRGIQRGQETAGALKATIERLRPDQAADLYRLLWGYSVDQLAKDEAANLVKFLESEHMDVRVLAIQNLMTITGAMEFYRAEKKPEDSRAAIQAWRSRLVKKTILYKTPPAAIEPYKPLDRPPAAASELSAPRGAVGPVNPEERR